MAADKPDKDDAQIVTNGRHQPVLVPADIKYYPAILENTRGRILGLDFKGAFPSGLLGFPEPRAQRLLGALAGGTIPKLPQTPSADDSHG